MPKEERSKKYSKRWFEKSRRLIDLGYRLVRKGDFKTAKRTYERLDEFHPNEDFKVFYKGEDKYGSTYSDGLAFSYEKLGEFDKAAERYKKIGGILTAGDMYVKGGDFESAERAYKEAIKKYGEGDRLTTIAKEKLNGLKEGRNKESLGGLEIATATTAIIGVIGGFFFLSTGITGNVIGNLNSTSSNIIGGALFFVGLVGAFFYFKKSKRKISKRKTKIKRDSSKKKRKKK